MPSLSEWDVVPLEGRIVVIGKMEDGNGYPQERTSAWSRKYGGEWMCEVLSAMLRCRSGRRGGMSVAVISMEVSGSSAIFVLAGCCCCC